jgi:NitT/TauT family transport system substrate-binding protein
MVRKLVEIPILSVALFVMLLVGCSRNSTTSANEAAGSDSSETIRVGTNRALGTMVPFIANEKGFFQQQGLHVNVVDFADGSPIEAFASGQLDIALLGIAPSAIWQGQGVNLKVVAAANGGGHVLLTRTDSGIADLQQLKGRKVATPKPGTVTDTLFRAHIAREIAHLDPEKDIRIVPDVAPGDMPTALFVSREVDAAITWEPYASQAEMQFKNAKVLYDSAAEWRKTYPGSGPLYPVNVVIARQAFIDAHPMELRKFLAAYVQAIKFVNDSPDEANKMIADNLQLDPAIVASARHRIDYTWHVDPDASLKTLEWSAQSGYLKEIPTASKLFDLSYLPAD